MTPDVNVVISHSEYTVLVVDDVVSNVLLLMMMESVPYAVTVSESSVSFSTYWVSGSTL